MIDRVSIRVALQNKNKYYYYYIIYRSGTLRYSILSSEIDNIKIKSSGCKLPNLNTTLSISNVDHKLDHFNYLSKSFF